MRYLCLGYHDYRMWEQLSERDRATLTDETVAYIETLKKNGHVLDDTGLQPPSSAATLRFERTASASSGGVAITDGPYAETKEQIGGVMTLSADDLNHAIQLMSQLPCMRIGGSLEIRPINEALSS